MTFSATSAGKKPAPTPKPAPEPITVEPVRIHPHDPWADSIDSERLTAEGRAALPDDELAPDSWFRLSPATRARLGGLVRLCYNS